MYDFWSIRLRLYGYFHNVDAARHRLVGFNLAADLLEHLDSEILAPRVTAMDGVQTEVFYPFPSGSKLLSLDDASYTERLRRLGVLEIVRNNSSKQELVFHNGRVEVGVEGCRAYGFTNYDLVNITEFMANITDWCSRVVG